MAQTDTATTQTPSKTQDSGEDPPLLLTSTTHKTKNEANSEEDTISKRRKICPSALEKIEEISKSNQNFSFTFDTKLSGNSTQFTPKFGSFNLEKIASTQEKESGRLPERLSD
ncbi:hypothetical protein MANES_08G162000v8 [Manihot esculenta]|uniref:Uncharacterized protein n=1 Tax=Manihot esculenta TaxID=3983 RepID=A0A2C9VIU2_MANES|nr:hypothetical protein MANES_08G162000v8 [Manihot esculenta]